MSESGIERLRGLARRMDGLGVWPGGGRLRDIAAQIEREHAQTCEDHERQQQIIRDLQRERDEALRELRVLRDSTAEGQVLAVGVFRQQPVPISPEDASAIAGKFARRAKPLVEREGARDDAC